MGTFAFQTGSTFKVDRKSFTLRRKFEGFWQAEDLSTLQVQRFSDQDLKTLYAAGELRFVSDRTDKPRVAVPPVYDMTDPRFETAKVRLKYVRAIEGLHSTRSVIKPVIEETWKKIKLPEQGPPNPATVIRWRNLYRKGDSELYALIDQTNRKGNRKPRIGSREEDLIAEAIGQTYMRREPGTVQDTLDSVKALIARDNRLEIESQKLKLPSYYQVQQRILRIPEFDRWAARFGREAAVRRFRGVKGHTVSDAPLARAEIDHTVLDLMVVDDTSGLPLGRPYLTVCVDAFSRCVLGVHISFDPPSFLSVSRCLRHALLPKPAIREQYPIVKNDWPAYGVMDTLVVDNGPEFHSDALENACYTLGIEITYSPRKQPWFKSIVERFIGSLNRGVAHKAPGTTFDGIEKKGDYDVVASAAVSYKALQGIVFKWICDVYHEKPHSALNEKPVEVWRRSISDDEIRHAEDPDLLTAILAEKVTRQLSHKGIVHDGLWYNSGEMTALRAERGDTLMVDTRVDRGDLGSIVVLLDNGTRYCKVPAVAKEYAAGLTKWQHSVIRRHALRKDKKEGVEGWIEAKAELADEIRKQFSRQKIRTRQRLARYMDAELKAGTLGTAVATAHRENPASDNSMHEGGPTAPNPASAGSSAEAEIPSQSAPSIHRPARHRKTFDTTVVDRHEADDRG